MKFLKITWLSGHWKDLSFYWPSTMSSWDISYMKTNDSCNTIVNRLAKSCINVFTHYCPSAALLYSWKDLYLYACSIFSKCSQHLYMLGGRNGNVALRDFWRYSIGKFLFGILASQVSSWIISAKNSWEPIRGGGDAPGCLQDHTMVAFRSLLDSVSVGCFSIIINTTYLGGDKNLWRAISSFLVQIWAK